MYKLIKHGDVFNSPIKKFVCDTYEEALSIKESILFGSVLYVVSEDKYYIYNSKQQWIKQEGEVDYV